MGAVVQDRFTIGVEEEFLTVDAKSLELRPRADRVLAATRPVLGSAVQAELNLAQIEVATPVCDSLDVLEAELRRARAALAAGAATRNSAIVATGTHPCAQWVSQAITPADRYLELEEDYQQLAREQLICGCHVHVGIDDPDRAIRIMDRVRSWVPVLLAFAANSPYWQGVDTGYASYRTQVFDRWPTAGPAPLCGDRAGYERMVSELVEVGMIADETYVYWHVRPSSQYPTLELRAADVALCVDDAVTLAALFRALVRTCDHHLDREPCVFPSHELVRAATWRASRYGLDGSLIDLRCGDEVPAADMVRRLLTHVRPDCDSHDEWRTLVDRVETTIARGNGAQRQRDAFAETGSLRGVTQMTVQQPARRSVPLRIRTADGPRAGAFA
jgi:glutamate---cysteine ligase / carboxylate-amine ligase